MFCPFIKDECNDECVFIGYNIDLPNNCDLYDAIQVIRSFQAPGNEIDKRLNSIESKLSSIKSNTGSDQTDSYYIHGELRDIKELLSNLTKKD